MNNRLHAHPPAKPSSRRRLAFTLLELLAGISAAVLITLALATLFSSAGATVSVGQRVSKLNRIAASVEHQMRADFRAITREGALVIRHAYAYDRPLYSSPGAPEPLLVPLYLDQPMAERRPRRVDEIVFFANGNFSTARSPLSTLANRSGTSARIYYGHGSLLDLSSPRLNAQQRELLEEPDFNFGVGEGFNLHDDPEVMGYLGQPGGVNELAAEWALLRHVTVLIPPSANLVEIPDAFPGFTGNLANNARLRDGSRQVGFQPAMPTLFRYPNALLGEAIDYTGSPEPTLRHQGAGARSARMIAASGLVDIATMDLADAMAYVRAMHTGIGPGAGAFNPVGPYDAEFVNDPIGVRPRRNAPGGGTPLPQTQAELTGLVSTMQAWMRQLMPADSDGEDAEFGPNQLAALGGVRMRTAFSPPNLFREYTNEFQRADRPNDQIALVNNNFVGARAVGFRPRTASGDRVRAPSRPRSAACSEFIVEWSFGQIEHDPDSPNRGELIWYGSADFVDNNNSGTFTPGSDQPFIRLYRSDISFDPDTVRPLVIDNVTGQFFTNADRPADRSPTLRAIANRTYAGGTIQGAARIRAVQEGLIHGIDPIVASGPVYAYFAPGTDPTYDPQSQGNFRTPQQLANIADPIARAEAAAVQPRETVEWPWPKLVRITMTLADPEDPTFEQTYQFVFDLGN